MPALKRLPKRRILGCPFMRMVRWSLAGTAMERARVRGVSTRGATVTFSHRLAGALRPLPAERSEEKCHNDRARGRTHPCRSEAQLGLLEPRISEDPLTDPPLWLFGRFRRDRARGGVCI